MFKNGVNILLLMMVLLLIFDNQNGLVNAKRKGGKSKKSVVKSAFSDQINGAKMQVKGRFCADIVGSELQFNCIHYNLSPNCFMEAFGESGIELGEVVNTA